MIKLSFKRTEEKTKNGEGIGLIFNVEIDGKIKVVPMFIHENDIDKLLYDPEGFEQTINHALIKIQDILN